jgi:hypothetical protein
VRHPRLPLGIAWLPVLSAAVYALAWTLRAVLWFVPAGRRAKGRWKDMPVTPREAGALLTQLAWVVLCSGSYVLFDVRVPEEHLSVSVRMV